MEKITISKKQFDIWVRNYFPTREFMERAWSALVAESQKPDLIERWCIVSKKDPYGALMFYTTEDLAKRDLDSWKDPYNFYIIKLREVV